MKRFVKQFSGCTSEFYMKYSEIINQYSTDNNLNIISISTHTSPNINADYKDDLWISVLFESKEG